MRKNQPEVDEVKGFLYLSEAGKPLVAFQWAKKFEYAVLHHNCIYKKELPKITPQICRHTYCSNMIKAGVNPKVVQYLMGHSSSEITLNIYTHIHLEDVIKKLSELNVFKIHGHKL